VPSRHLPDLQHTAWLQALRDKAEVVARHERDRQELDTPPGLAEHHASQRRPATPGKSITIAGKLVTYVCGLLTGWSSAIYQVTGDQIVKSDLQNRDLKKFYNHVPDEFYQHHGHFPVVTPSNCDEFMWFAEQYMNETNTTIVWDVWERYSCSARLTDYCAKSNIAVGFPVDYRHGCDLSDPAHCALLDRCDSLFQPKIVFASPECRNWGNGSKQRDQTIVQQAKTAETSSLTWTAADCNRSIRRGGGAVIEQPWRSSLFDKSPMHAVVPNTRSRKVDQCAHGARHPAVKTSLIKKESCLRSNLVLRSTQRTCNCKAPHGNLQERDPVSGLTNTSLSAVYPRGMCIPLVSDFKTFLQLKKETDKQAYLALYTCPRCKGDKDTEHSRIAGECKLHGHRQQSAKNADAIKLNRDRVKTPGVQQKLSGDDYRRRLKRSLRHLRPVRALLREFTTHQLHRLLLLLFLQTDLYNDNRQCHREL
jgi:hypothetical protein